MDPSSRLRDHTKSKNEKFYLCQCSSYGCGTGEHVVFLPGRIAPSRGRLLCSRAECLRHSGADQSKAKYRIRGSVSDEEIVVGSESDKEEDSHELYTPLDRIEAAYAARKDCRTYDGLVFKRSPQLSTSDVPDPIALELLLSDNANTAFLAQQFWLQKTLKEVSGLKTTTSAKHRSNCDDLRTQIQADLTKMDICMRSQWTSQRNMANKIKMNKGPSDIDTEPFFRSSNLLRGDPITSTCFLLVAVLHLLCHVSIRHCSFVLTALNNVLSLSANDDGLSSKDINHLSSNLRTVTSQLDLEPTYRSFVCCGACFKCFEEFSADEESIPSFCDARAHPTAEPCLNKLLKGSSREGVIRQVPTRRFMYQDLKDWMGRLLCRPSMEELLDRVPYHINENEIDAPTYDIWDGKALRNLKGPDGRYFIHEKGRKSEGRYVFALCMDSFNPLRSKDAGKKYSTGAIYMVCLNLPPSARYQLENAFLVGIIPGPQEPSKEQINYLLKPLVDDLLHFYFEGVRYSHTPCYPQGRKVRIMLGPLVCDLPAARQMAGFASHSHSQFCSICMLHRDDINELSEEKFRMRINKEHRKQAHAWLHARTQGERDHLYAENGVRWSELLRLPYWKPVLMTVIDTMHALFLGLLKWHSRVLWGMDLRFQDGDGTEDSNLERPAANNPQVPTIEEHMNAHFILRHGTNTDVRGLRQCCMLRLCEELELPARRKETKKYLAAELLNYRVRQGWYDHQGHSLAASQDVVPDGMTIDVSTDKQEEAIYCFEHVSFSVNGRRGIAGFPISTLVFLCKLYIPTFDATRAHDLTKRDLLELLYKLRMSLDGEKPAAKVVGSSRPSRVLGRKMLPEIWADMEKTILPSWLTSGPREVGTARCGKLSADQWRTTCSVHMVVTLGRLWGVKSADDRFYAMFSNFMELVSATKLATMRSLTHARIKQFENYIRLYLTGTKTLYKHKFSPNQHLSLHLGYFLRQFGPVHGWRSYPFERWNHVLQSIKTNMRLGDLEVTMFRRFCGMQRLFALWTDGFPPTELSDSLRAAFYEAFRYDGRGTLLNDLRAMHQPTSPFFEVFFPQPGVRVAIPEDHARILQLAKDKLLVSHKSFSYRGMRYKIHVGRLDSHTVGDSHIVLGSDVQADWVPCRIEAIYEIISSSAAKPSIQIVAREYDSLDQADILQDPYRLFPVAGGRIYYSSFRTHLRVISPSEILCHFALTPDPLPSISRPHIHVLPLDRD